MEDERLFQGVWWIDTVGLPFICPCIMVQIFFVLSRSIGVELDS